MDTDVVDKPFDSSLCTRDVRIERYIVDYLKRYNVAAVDRDKRFR